VKSGRRQATDFQNFRELIVRTHEDQLASAHPTSLVLRQLQDLRREMAAILESQRRDRELITRFT
jgi:hypothetical protein